MADGVQQVTHVHHPVRAAAPPGFAVAGAAGAAAVVARAAVDQRWLWVAAALFMLFLVMEPLRSHIRAAAGQHASAGWILFLTLRLAALAGSAIAFYRGLPRECGAAPHPVPRPERGQDPLLTLRAFACLLVLAGHALGIAFVPSDIPARLAGGNAAWALLGNPWAGVWVFFVLSGYLMGKGFYSGRYGLSQAQVGNFYRNRLIRIVPVYYAVLLLVSALVSPGIYAFANAWEILGLLTFSQMSQAPHAVVGALWSIQTEVAFYAFVPLIFLGLKEAKRRTWVVAGLLVFGLAYRYVLFSRYGVSAEWIERIYVPLIGNLDLFVFGMALNWLVPAFAGRTKTLPTLGASLLLLLAFYLAASWMLAQRIYGTETASFARFTYVAGPTVAAVFAGLAILLMESHVARGNHAGRLSLGVVRGTQLAGILTYAAYVWHEPIMAGRQALHKASPELWSSVQSFGMTLALTLTVAYFTYAMIEAPFERRKKAG